MAKSPFEKPVGSKNEVWMGPPVVGERGTKKAEAEDLLKKQAKDLESVRMPNIRGADKNAQFFDSSVKAKPEAQKSMVEEAERQMLEAHDRAAVIRAGLESIGQGQKPTPEFISDVELRLAESAKRLRESKDEWEREDNQKELAAYQELLDRIDGMK